MGVEGGDELGVGGAASVIAVDDGARGPAAHRTSLGVAFGDDRKGRLGRLTHVHAMLAPERVAELPLLPRPRRRPLRDAAQLVVVKHRRFLPIDGASPAGHSGWHTERRRIVERGRTD